MSSIFEGGMGDDFQRLHPMLQRRFGVGLEAGYASVGRGTMRRIRRGPWWTVPFLQLGRLRNILVPDIGTDVPFVIHNYPYRDPLGREAVTFVREYWIGGRARRFDATMVRASDGHVLDYLGSHQHLVVDLDLSVEDDGSLLLRSGAQRFYEGRVGFSFPMLFSGRAELRERYDDEGDVFRVDLTVTNPVFGFLFGYDGEFTCEFLGARDAPAVLKPSRYERRE
ncbi:DUF4166 domain-containing protein [Nocardioides sp. zg-1308]|uniref:DUF4166 domain-containing protein n=1 Tax=Nocardioides sp. zg-1308 TaxID=2736253 RepID=UPI001C1303C7